MIVMISTKLEEYTISIWETLTCPHSKEYSHMPGLGVIEGGGHIPQTLYGLITVGSDNILSEFHQ